MDGGGNLQDAPASVVDVGSFGDAPAAIEVSAATETSSAIEAPAAIEASGIAETMADVRSMGSGGASGTGGATGTGGTVAGTGGAVSAGGATGTSDAARPTGCPLPADPSNGSVQVSALTVGSTATYACTAGYHLSGVSQRKCQPDETWSEAAPTCIPVDCGPPPPPSNGKVEAPTTTYPSSATYACLANYGLSGDANRTCRADGTWSGTVPTCQCVQTMCDGACVNLQTDNGHCGGCGDVCSTIAPSTAQCASARCLVTLATAVTPLAITVDSTHVYWTDIKLDTPGTVMKVPLSGGAPTTIATEQNHAQGIAVDATYVYWTAWNDGAVVKAPLAGGPASIVASNENAPCGIAVDATHLYWGDGQGNIRRKSLGSDELYTIASQASNCTVVVDATHVYYRDAAAADTVMKAPLELGGTPTVLASGERPQDIAVDATSVYWTNRDGTVKKLPITGGTPTTLVSGQGVATGIAIDESHVYWTTEEGAVRKVPKGGGTPVTLATDQPRPWRIVVDSTNVYWTNSSYVVDVSGAVMKTQK